MEENDHISSDSASDEGFPDPMMEDDDDDLDNVSSGDENWFIFVKLRSIYPSPVFIMLHNILYLQTNLEIVRYCLLDPAGGQSVCRNPVFSFIK